MAFNIRSSKHPHNHLPSGVTTPHPNRLILNRVLIDSSVDKHASLSPLPRTSYQTVAQCDGSLPNNSDLSINFTFKSILYGT